MKKELLTVSRMTCLLSCPRKHYWAYEIGLQADSDAAALRFGSAWHKAMELRWKGMSYDEALEQALPEGELDERQAVTLMGMLAGYYAHYKTEDIELLPEIEFEMPLHGSRTFKVAGKIDGIGHMFNWQIMLEHKSTSDDISPASDYWLRLRFDMQSMQYLLAARENNWDPRKIIYDVVRKPSIAPKANVPILDQNSKKIVLDRDGKRVFKKDNSPRESGDSAKGYTVQTEPETLKAFGERLARDTQERPEFYFARKEVPVLDQDLNEFMTQRLELGKSILGYRQAQKRVKKPEQAWPRNCNLLTCRMCQYSSFCLNNVSVNIAHPPSGFKVGNIHQELTQKQGKNNE